MSNDKLKELPSIQGYINWQEMATVLLQGFGQPSILGLIVFALSLLAESASRWYTGPQAAAVIAVFTTLAAFLRTKTIAEKLIKEGSPLP